MTLLISTRLVIILSISPFILLGVFVLSIFHPLNVTNLLLSLHAVLLWGIEMLIKVLFVMMLLLTSLVHPEM